ncbi:hypothetical protein BTA35_0205440 [Oceanospirillum linum]|uniref:Cytochrome c domain-containing protein n=2 Tax=Oceanospirillum linum TaxID=966 RepID=A0A1T1HCG1_OCELI|nr:hypothetical protein BTA35_0205440 [Oceanospirillum linum]
MLMKKQLKPRIASLVLALSCGGASGLALADADPIKGQQTSAMCIACHQADGNGKSNAGAESWPRLAGLNAEYIEKQLRDFRGGLRQSATMMPFANMLTEQQIKNVSAYYAQLTPTHTEAVSLTDEQQALGKRLAVRGDWDRYIPACNSCHGPDAAGVGKSFPELAGQHSDYIRQQLHAWKNGSRSNDPNNLMLAVAKRMTEQDIDAVALWLAKQPIK